jgi:hypothetical protein
LRLTIWFSASADKKFFSSHGMGKIIVTKLPHTMIINEPKVVKFFCDLNDFRIAGQIESSSFS